MVADYQCPKCGSAVAVDPEGLQCPGCTARYLVRHGIADFLTDISDEVAQELRGLAAEQGVPDGDLEQVKLRLVDHLPTWEEQVAWTRDDPILYYRQTMETFLEAFARVRVHSGHRVLEIGGEKRFPLLQHFHRHGADCFAANIFFEVERSEGVRQWPSCVLSDMHHLPFADGYFDFIVISAAAHHSPRIDQLFAELSRVLVPGGILLLLNELVAGYVKELGARRRGVRSELIHEERIPYLTYRRAIAKAGFHYHGFFPQHFARRLNEPDRLNPSTRFLPIALGVSWLWQRQPRLTSGLADLTLPLAQALLGFPLNALLVRGPDEGPA